MTRHDADHWAMKCLDCEQVVGIWHRRELFDVKDRTHECFGMEQEISIPLTLDDWTTPIHPTTGRMSMKDLFG